jgi:hypothetical protein
MFDGIMVGAAANEEDFTVVMVEHEIKTFAYEHPEIESDDACFAAVEERLPQRAHLYKMERIG